MPAARRTARFQGLAYRPAFTLIEACIVMIIIGVGCVGMLQLLAAGTMANAGAAELTTALMLASNIREATANCYFASNGTSTMSSTDYYSTATWRSNSAGSTTPATWQNVDDFDGASFSPAIDARCQSLSQYANWTQNVTVELMDPNLISSVTAHPSSGASWTPASTPFQRVTVNVLHNGKAVTSISWLVSYAPAIGS